LFPLFTACIHSSQTSNVPNNNNREKCFVAESAHVFAEPGRDVVVGGGAHIGADVFLHGPVTLEEGVAVNARCHIDGGSRGVLIGKNSRLGPGCYMFAFNHGIDPGVDIKDQQVSSEGIIVGQDCWLGAAVCVTDGVRIGDHAVIGMGAVVTGDVPEWAVMGGNPARQIGDRRTWASRRDKADDAGGDDAAVS
jgi:acetyltransferase-like isoleucine patch superfamily enzyme